LRRLRRGAPVWRAHAEHFYQRAARAVGHARVVGAVTLVDLGLVALAVLCTILPRATAAWLVLGAALTAALLWYLACRTPTPDNASHHPGEDHGG